MNYAPTICSYCISTKSTTLIVSGRGFVNFKKPNLLSQIFTLEILTTNSQQSTISVHLVPG